MTPRDELADRHRRLYPGVVGHAVRHTAAVGDPGRSGGTGFCRGRAAPPADAAESGGDDPGGDNHLGWPLCIGQPALAQLLRPVSLAAAIAASPRGTPGTSPPPTPEYR